MPNWPNWLWVSPRQAPILLRYGSIDIAFNKRIGFIQNKSFHIWQSFFWICGSVTFAYGVILLIFLPDNPVKAKFINDREKAISIERVRVNQTGKNISNAVYLGTSLVN